MKRIVLVIWMFLIHGYILAQILPKEDRQLNYRIIGFSFPKEREAGGYTLEIALGHFNTTDSFKRNIIKSIVCKTNSVIAEVPYFGSDYTWCILCTGKKGKTTKGLHHFSTGTSIKIDTDNFRLRIVHEAEKYKDAYIFIDETHTLYDMNGSPVWFLPNINGKVNERTVARDLKITRQGTITFMSTEGIFEISYDGRILWEGPDNGAAGGDSMERYHHEFTRLNNGHYMTLGKETVFWESPDYPEDSEKGGHALVHDSDHVFRQQMGFGTVMEYDKEGRVVWSWKSVDYFRQSDFGGLTDKNRRLLIGDTHENSFFFDEQKGYVYVGFRNISRILKLKYPQATVVADYGTRYSPGVEEMGTDMFCGQHSINISKDGYLYVFNNNSFPGTALPKIDMMQEPPSGKGALKKVWQYQCNLDGLSDSEKIAYNNRPVYKKLKPENKKRMMRQFRMQFTTGGNAVELPDKSLFVSSCDPFGKIFIINKGKNILWSSVFETRSPEAQSWAEKSTYRASIIPDRKALGQLIWNAEKPSPVSLKGR